MKVMIVDDDEDIRQSLRAVLEDEGISVLVAANGLEALQRLASGDRPTVILLDLMMPKMNGWEFLEERRKDPALAGIPIVIISAHDGVAGKLGPPKADAYIRKPFKAEALLQVVNRFRPLRP